MGRNRPILFYLFFIHFKNLKVIRFLTILLLAVTGIPACVGGLSLILDTTGEWLGLSLHQLTFLPFKDYFLPGVVLFSVIGIGSIMLALLVEIHSRKISSFVVLQGVIVFCWIIFQSFLLPRHVLQLVFGIIGLL